MPLETRPETTIERILREVTGRKMPASVRQVLLPTGGKPKYKAKPQLSELYAYLRTDFLLTCVI
jgi:hypothetical protein